MKYLTFLVESEKNDEYRYEELLEDDQDAPVISIKKNHRGRLKNILQLLPGDIPLFVLFHLGDKKGNKFNGEKMLTNFSRVIPGLKVSKNKYFFSQSENEVKKSTVIHFSEVEHIPNERYNLIPHTPWELLTPNNEQLDYDYSLRGNKYNQWLFEQDVNALALKIILGLSLPEKASEVRIKVLTPGFSGAHVLEVKYKHKDITQRKIIKMDRRKGFLEKEFNFSYDYAGASLSTIKFITADRDKGISYIMGWYTLTYRSAINGTSLTDFILSKKAPEIKNAYSKLISLILDDFQEKIGKIELIESSCWKPSQQQYEGLMFKNSTKKGIIREIEFTLDKFGNRIGLNKSDKDYLINFVKDYHYKGLEIDQQSLIITSRTHGDLHPENVLTDNNGENFEIIDFALTSENYKHAFLDIAKLLVATEINIIPDDLFILNKGAGLYLQEWVDVHRVWVNEISEWKYDELKEKWVNENNNKFLKGLTSKEHKPYISKAYHINEMVKGSIKKYVAFLQSKNKIPNNLHCNLKSNVFLKDFTIQFLQIRLHYLLKYISYSNIILVKRFFAIRACIDILECLLSRREETI